MKRILFLEDEPSIADAIGHCLTQEGFEANHVGTLAEARKSLGENYDLVILDIGLPDGSGLDLCKEIRQGSNVPVFFLTAKSDEIDRVLGLELGADDYITKPFSPRELVARTKSLFRRLKTVEESDSSEIKTVGEFQIDESRFQIFLNSQALNLSRYEFGILKMLLENPERVYSRAQIMERVWAEPDMSLERTIDAHIKAIRKKIKLENDSLDPIKTHRGLGYSYTL